MAARLIMMAVLMMLLSSLTIASERVSPADVSLPGVSGPVDQTADSYAFNGAAQTRVPQDLAASGYLEEEYFISGTGRIYDLPSIGDLRSVGQGEYVTRILVRRPKDPEKFNGAVIVEPFNPSHMADVDLMWIYSRTHFMRNGYIWVGVTFKPVAGEALRRFDPARYRTISFANPLPKDSRCADKEIEPDAKETEIGFAFDILSQVGALLRSDAAANPLSQFEVSRAYLTGYSQTAGLARSYATAISSHATRDGSKKIYDAYVYAGHAPFNVLFNNCDSLNDPDDTRLRTGPVGVPMVDIVVEGDFAVTNFLRRTDSDSSPDLFRRYEIAGATHSGSLVGPYTPRAEDFSRAGGFETTLDGCAPSEPSLSHFPLDHILNAIWQNTDKWVVDNVPPPRADSLRLLQASAGSIAAAYPEIERDRLGIAVGGVRSVAVDVPTVRWHGSRDGLSRCRRIGYSQPFDNKALKELYPSHADYVRQVSEAARRLQLDRWLTAEDAQLIIDAAWHSSWK